MQILGFLIEALFFTNLWIFFYNNLLKFLNIKFPAIITEPFIRRGAAPEPFEIPLYFVITFITVIIIYLLHKTLKNNSFVSGSRFIILKLLVLVFLIWLFFINLDGYPLKGDIYPYPIRRDFDEYILYFVAYISIVLFIIIQSSIINRILNFEKKIFFFLFSFFILIIIAVFTFVPGFPISGHDYSYFYGPIQQISQGKTIYTDAPSQYGFLSVLIIAAFNKINLFSFSFLPILVWILYIIQYYICFYLIFKISRSFLLALLALFSIITLNYFSLYHFPLAFPQIGPMRWLPVVLTILVFFKSKKIDSKGIAFLVGLLTLWAIDTGIYIILAYLFSLFIFFISRVISFRKALLSAVWFTLNLIIIFVAINLIHIIFGYQQVNFISLFSVIQDYAKAGFGMLPMETKTYFWTVIFIYFSSIIYFLRKKGKTALDCLLVITANLSIFTSTYYVGRTHPHNLFNIAVLPIVNLFLFVGIFWREKKFLFLKPIAFLIIFLILIVLPLYFRKEAATEIIKGQIDRLSYKQIFQPEMNRILQKKYAKELPLINKYFPERKILILSDDDTYLLYLLKKENLFDNNPQILILSEKQLDYYVSRLLKNGCPQKIVTDCTYYKRCPEHTKFNETGFSTGTLILDKIRANCQGKYEPVECTYELCIVFR